MVIDAVLELSKHFQNVGYSQKEGIFLTGYLKELEVPYNGIITMRTKEITGLRRIIRTVETAYRRLTGKKIKEDIGLYVSNVIFRDERKDIVKGPFYMIGPNENYSNYLRRSLERINSFKESKSIIETIMSQIGFSCLNCENEFY